MRCKFNTREKHRYICFLMKNFKSIQYHDQASMLSKVNYQTNTSTYVFLQFSCKQKVPKTRTKSLFKSRYPETNNTRNFLMEIFKSIAFQNQASIFKTLYGRPTLLKNINTIIMIPDQQHWPTIEHEFLVPRKTRKDETIFFSPS